MLGAGAFSHRLLAKIQSHMSEGEECCCRYTNILVQPNGEQLSHIVELIDSGKIKVHIHKVWHLEKARCSSSISADSTISFSIIPDCKLKGQAADAWLVYCKCGL